MVALTRRRHRGAGFLAGCAPEVPHERCAIRSRVARGLGSAKDGTGHWWVQRLTAVALLLLTPWFLWLVLGLVGADQLRRARTRSRSR